MIQLRNIERLYKTGAGATYVLRRINLDINPGDFITVMGPSGAGKSTLLSILGMLDDNWTGEIDRAKPILQDPLNCSMTGMTYIPNLGRYVMVVWHYTTYNLRTDPRTINTYYEAPKPWGPWTKFKTIDTDKLGWYVPIVGQKFQKLVDVNTVDCILFPTGNYQNRNLYKLNFIPITLSTVPLATTAGK